jgi:hypothetical protein
MIALGGPMKKADVHLRLPVAVHKGLTKAAEKNRRPVTLEILVRLEESLARSKP